MRMNDPIVRLNALTRSRLDQLHEGVTRLVLTDFPDHGNIGDSAIALGEQAYWRAAGIDLVAVQSQATLRRSTLRTHMPVAIHGGGNLGGSYPSSDAHRFKLAAGLHQTTMLLQEPQTVHFTSDARRAVFQRDFAYRAQTRISVRDSKSFDDLRQMTDNLVLSPDPVHLLGSISSPSATQGVLHVRRADNESSGRLREGLDWPADPRDLNAFRWWANRAAKLPPAGLLFQRRADTWMRKAQRRFDLGVAFLSQGETIVTDRLHAMLMGLQMGRNVVALDNSYGKLTSYAQTWLGEFGGQLRVQGSV
jgi:exopolysaccharide biosynthesis predicted pyruvyltransferase EpsI